MKRLLIPVVLAAALSGCAVVSPYEHGYYAAEPPYAYAQPDTVYPGYAVPAPMLGPPIYVGPPIRFSFGLQFWSGRGRHHGHRHGFGGHGFGHGPFGGFRGHGFHGGHGRWRH